MNYTKCKSLLIILILYNGSLYCALTVTPAQAKEIGKKIWHNECAGTLVGLTSWNDGEDFASLGIGHFIWYPEGKNGVFRQTFPSLLKFLEKNNKKLPAGILKKGSYACPWPNRTTFLQASSTKTMADLRTYLAGTIDLQTTFIIERLNKALPLMLKYAPKDKKEQIKNQFDRVYKSKNGLYALIDYLNFKGEGCVPHEKYQGYRWGLLQVLEKMNGTAVGTKAIQEFVTCAQDVLHQRVAHAPHDESKWLRGWEKRLKTYLQ